MDDWMVVNFEAERIFEPFPGEHEDVYYRVQRNEHQDGRLELTNWVQLVGITVGQPSIMDIGRELHDLCGEIPEQYDYIEFKFNQGQEDVYYRWGTN